MTHYTSNTLTVLAFRISTISKPATYKLNNAWENGNNDDAKNEKSQIIFHHRHVTKEKSAEYKEADPENAAERTECYV